MSELIGGSSGKPAHGQKNPKTVIGPATIRAMLGEAGIDPNGAFARAILINPEGLVGDRDALRACIQSTAELAMIKPSKG